MVEVMNRKKEFNARARELTGIGYTKSGEFGNSQRFRKHVFLQPDLEIVLVQGWKKR